MANNGNGGDAAQQQWQGAAPTTPVPGGGPPDGRSPNAKRPLNRDTISMAASEVKVLGMEDLSAGVHTLHMNAERDRKWVESVVASVAHNAQMLDGVINRLNGVDAVQKLMGESVDTLDGKVLKLAVNSEATFEKVHGEDVKRDGDLRRELDQMATKLEQGPCGQCRRGSTGAEYAPRPGVVNSNRSRASAGSAE